jgi:hypothetical protein
MSRDRLEDLGRLAVLIENILAHDIFSEDRVMANDYEKWFESLEGNRRHELMAHMYKSIPEIEYALEEALKIAEGTDILNGIH